MLLMVMGASANRSQVSVRTLVAEPMRNKERRPARPTASAVQGLALGAQGSSVGAASLVFLGAGVRATGVFAFLAGSAADGAALVGVSSTVSGAAALVL